MMLVAASDERECNAWRRMRKQTWYLLLPYIKKGEQGTELDLFPLPGDPTEKELEAMKEEALKQREKMADEAMDINKEFMERLRKDNLRAPEAV
jgi:hypothetical protein